MNSKQLNILLADDDMDDCKFFREALAELSIATHLTTVNDGQALMNRLSQSNEAIPDVLFLDINMPRKSGSECLSEIRRNTKLKGLPVVMFSTSNAWDVINKLFMTGADVYIHKPSDFTQLKQVIQHALPMAAEKAMLNSPIKYVLNA